MSNRLPDELHDHLSSVLRFTVEQFRKTINISIPATVISYDAVTRRATVQPAINILTTADEELKRPPLVDVPFIWLSTGGYIVHSPVRKGDAVMLLISQRGLTDFKRRYAVASCAEDPDIMSMRDAVVIPGFGTHGDTEIPEPDALTCQTEDGEQRISINANGDIKARSTRLIRLDAPRVEINGDNNVVVTGGRIDLN